MADSEPDDFQEFQLEVSTDGVLSFPDESVDSEPIEQPFAAAAASPSACSDKAYSTNDVKEYGTYNWYIGDGGMPAGLSRSAAKTSFADAINNITGSTNNCSYTDQVSAASAYKGTTTVEADINSSGNCTTRDKVSTWDAGNLQTGVVASTCTWWTVPSPGIKNDLVEADVRYNTTDYSFTNNPTSGCSNLYDVRSVGTHEAGHVIRHGPCRSRTYRTDYVYDLVPLPN